MVKHCRNELGLSHAELAKQTGLSKPTISRMEAGKSPAEVCWKAIVAMGKPRLIFTVSLGDIE